MPELSGVSRTSLLWPNIGNPETFDETKMTPEQEVQLADAYSALVANPAFRLWRYSIDQRIATLSTLDYIISSGLTPKEASTVRDELRFLANVIDQMTEGY